jgi:Zn-dependent protease with chaperone function
LPQREEVLGAVRLRLGWPLLLLMPITLLGLVPEVLQAHRSSFVFALVTTPGVMLAGVVLLLASVLLLPWCFRFAFGPRPLPEPAGGRLRETARRLDFPPGSVLQLPTGMRTLNAMMVGPLPFGRCLCITDGLLRTLDVEALNGVVAHEVGHARAGHPGLLLTIALVLSATALAAVRCLELDQQAPFVQAGLLLGGMLLVWAIVRSMAHRFEHEADAASVDALGAGPCTEALRVVSRLAMPVAHGWLGRATSLHPEEPARWQFMRRYELDPAFRADFVASGRRLRFGILAAAAGAMVITGLGWSLDWPFEQARWRLHAGDVVAAHELAQAAPAVPKRWQPAWLEFEQDLRVARELAPEARDWATAQARYAAAGWSRGEAELLAKGPAAARAWFGCALAAIEHPTAVQRAIYAFCAAADDIDLDRMEAVKVTLQRLGVPERLAPVFADPPPR